MNEPKLTRAEAICACNNLQALAESLEELITEKGSGGYVSNIHSTAEDMQAKFVSGFHPSLKQSAYIRKMWSGLRRWDRQNEHPDDMFHGLAEIEREMSTPAAAPAAAPKRGVETSSNPHNDAPPDSMYPAKPVELPEGQPPPGSMYAKPPAAEEPMPDWMLSDAEISKKGGTWLPSVLERIATTRERQFETTRLQMEQANNRHIDYADVQHGNLAHVLNMTSSERTKDLIRAAEICGKVSAITALSGNMEDAMRDLWRSLKRGA